jgi:predicted amidohydrolase
MLIKNGYLFTTCTNDFEKLDIRIENTKITEVDFNISPKENEEVIDAAGKYITPLMLTVIFVSAKKVWEKWVMIVAITRMRLPLS